MGRDGGGGFDGKNASNMREFLRESFSCFLGWFCGEFEEILVPKCRSPRDLRDGSSYFG